MIHFLIAPDFAPESFAGWHLLNTLLQKITDNPIRLITPTGHREQMDILRNQKVTLVYANPFDAAQLVREQGYLPLVKPRAYSDEMLITSYADSPYQHSDELKAGCKILVTENQDLRLLGLRLLESANLTEQDIEWIEVDTFQEAARLLINQEADAAFFLVSTYLHFMPNTRQQMKTLMQSRIGDLCHVILLHPDDTELHDFFRDTFIQIGNTDDGEKVLQDLDMRGFDAVSQEDMEFMIDLMETLKD
ncbi:PhnD/SsuA/transferrin family substrate-binding protein [Kingella kingae]|uniref:PhnD/SsuA/transferrin family substrate-binding protein n=1 Tax=Kingella kingae TaxID=504 RepID=UPI0004056606|nr:PhnD/SsuA/transferrin family substrate-binding protein [Kingella kingae]MBD3613646.1 PhnD/SsuA/transferrin family substrate-binding protein [Kingella kingae]MBD3632192.1 PhnD/SsuA/transferrin family substrate-binding protein [Kingella kingae]MBD3659716.1 PhnD/SsuA/transferrin family substrate-binding protein [Kingella kingae]MDK4545360.1 PhnD/SsuA/transferrin family substrate-binding protein [Kingella kingae]MDK4567343.1 PhnD/SsuA/transferrin family substrate-binding protein [Kingella kinga